MSIFQVTRLFFSVLLKYWPGKLDVKHRAIEEILKECGEPEDIDDSPETTPSKRLESLFSRYKKTFTGIAIAKQIGLHRIREKCLIFNEWLTKIENISGI